MQAQDYIINFFSFFIKKKTYDKSWYAALVLGLNAIAVTAPVCPRKTDIGKPSGKRHYENKIFKHKVPKESQGRMERRKQ